MNNEFDRILDSLYTQHKNQNETDLQYRVRMLQQDIDDGVLRADRFLKKARPGADKKDA